MSKMTLSEELSWRGYINQTTFKDIAQLDNKKWTFYHGFDASADSQTIGNLAGMMLDRLFMRHGNEAIILAGGATSMIGDPGGKDVERPLQDEDTVRHNVEQAEVQLKRVFKDHKFTLVNNLDWTKDMTVINFLRDVGKHFGISSLIQRDYIANRLGEEGSGISFTELSYTLLQGLDYQHLYDTYGCELQLSGSDQWGNCISGIDLIRKSRGVEVHALTMPLIINKTTGVKFGKSEAGAVWLDDTKTSVFKFYQFWLNVDDESVEDYLKIYTELDKEALESLMAEFNSSRAQRAAQKTLAFEVTKIVHGNERAEDQRHIAEALFETRDFRGFTATKFQSLEKEVPFAIVKIGDSYVDALVSTGLASSNTEARRLIENGAVTSNGINHITAKNVQINSEDFLYGYAVISKGKKHLGLLKAE